jgi:hypothetical protein
MCLTALPLVELGVRRLHQFFGEALIYESSFFIHLFLYFFLYLFVCLFADLIFMPSLSLVPMVSTLDCWPLRVTTPRVVKATATSASSRCLPTARTPHLLPWLATPSSPSRTTTVATSTLRT